MSGAEASGRGSAAPLPAWPPAPAWAARLVRGWHRAECAIAVAVYAFVALVLIADVLGREVLGPIYRAVGIAGNPGVYAASKLGVYTLVLGSFIGVGIATATASHLQPRVGFGWVPKSWDRVMNRLGDGVSGGFFCALAWYGWTYVQSSMASDLRAVAFNIPIWPIQMFIPLGFLSAALRYFAFAAWPALRPQPPEFKE